jgi:U3 small nucleolar RNA-associated protein 14
MVRSGTRISSKKTRPTARKSNAVGYAKRQSHKQNVLKALDVYDHEQTQLRRLRVQVDTKLSQDELPEHLFGASGEDEDDGRQALRARLVGENEENEIIGSEEDEDIDSDAAFEESDEERFAGFFTNKVSGLPTVFCSLTITAS